jgi:hypothetical protein
MGGEDERDWIAAIEYGVPGGKETGQHVSHYVITGGAFAVAFTKLQATGFTLRWQSRTDDPQRAKKAAGKSQRN